MRVTLPLLYAATQQNIESRNEKIQGLTRRISSGKQLEAPHDDPRAWAQSRRLTEGLQRLERYKYNLEFANGLASVAESALDHIHDLLIRAKEVGTAANTPNSSAEKEAYKEDLEQIKEEIMSTAQTKYNGQYVFEGYFSSTTWVSARDTVPPDDARIISLDLDDRATDTEVSVDARSLFTGLVQTFEDLKTAIDTENSTDIANSLSSLEEAMETARKLSAQTGARLSAYERRLDALNTFQVHDQDRLSQIQDTDLVEAVTALKQNQIALEAALQSTAALQGLSLTRYL